MIEAHDLGKCYRIYQRPHHRLLETLGLGRNYHRPFWSLRHVYLTVARGSTFGLIGANGAGKSTLLRLFSGITRPTEGRLSVQGSVASILEMGSGFHPDFTGRSNVYMNCALQGFTREETDRLLPEIVRFSELEDFIDQPIRTYSTGMQARLAFAVASSVDPDILIIDEALSVGDEHFRHKCLDRLNHFKAQGKTIILVSHDLASVRYFCTQVALMDKGSIRSVGAPDEVLDQYLKITHKAQSKPGERHDESLEQVRWGTGEIRFESVMLRNAASAPSVLFNTGERVTLEAGFRVEHPVEGAVFGFLLYRSDGTYVNGSNHFWHKQAMVYDGQQPGEGGAVHCTIQNLPLLPGKYYITLCCYNRLEGFPQAIDHWERAYPFEVSEREMGQHGLIALDTCWDIEKSTIRDR